LLKAGSVCILIVSSMVQWTSLIFDIFRCLSGGQWFPNRGKANCQSWSALVNVPVETTSIIWRINRTDRRD